MLTDGMTKVERFHLFVRILDPEDYQFVRSRGPRVEKGFRRKRMRIFRQELRAITADLARSYRVRAGDVAIAGDWAAYPSLALDTVSGFLSIAKLYAAGILFAWRLPLMIDAARNADRVLRLVTSETFAATPPNLPV
jgi:hypothetical protein